MDELKKEYENLKKRIDLVENKKKHDEIWGITPKSEINELNLIKFEMDKKIPSLIKIIKNEEDEEKKRLEFADCKKSIEKVKELLDKNDWK